ncbi:MAG: sigma-70 family RNA polymerase sigma factor [Deltaproteobacteria bacterium]|nr:sigma-70 family RNA polymerase sigma factor [Deltaproteobacteria bacterium]
MAWPRFGKKTSNLDDFEALLEAHLDGLFRVALRYTRDRAQAEDLVQDTVVRALRFRDKFEPGTNFKAWTYTILTHTFIHKYRRQKREHEILEGASRADALRQLSSEVTRDTATRPEEVYLDRMLSDEVLAALDQLPEEFRTVVVLCDLEGLSYKEIADAVGSPVGTVMSRLYRGRRLLESKLHALAVERGIVRPDRDAAKAGVVDMSVFLRRRKDG